MKGAPVEPGPGALPCPACGEPMQEQGLDPSLMNSGFGYRGCELRSPSCLSCHGIWVEHNLLEQIINTTAKAASAERPRDIARRLLAMDAEIVYRNCPVCDERMQRRNFGSYSGVIVHKCLCGTFFEQGDLSAVVAFVRTGGLSLTSSEPPYSGSGRPPTPSGLPRRRVLPAIAPIPKVEQRGGNFFVEFARWLMWRTQTTWTRMRAQVVRLSQLRARTSRRPPR